MPRIKTCKGPAACLTYEQHKVASKATRLRHQTQKDDINDILDIVDWEATQLAVIHKKPKAYFLQQLHQGGRFARRKRDPNVFNGAQHAIGLMANDKEGMCHVFLQLNLQFTCVRS